MFKIELKNGTMLENLSIVQNDYWYRISTHLIYKVKRGQIQFFIDVNGTKVHMCYCIEDFFSLIFND